MSKNKFLAGALLSAALAGGGVAGVVLGAPAISGAQTATTSAATAPAAPTGAPSAPANSSAQPPSGPHQANGKTETLLTGDDLAKVTAATNAKVPGATIDRAETDADGDAYEAHITTSDGAKETVKFDASFNVTSVQTGMH